MSQRLVLLLGDFAGSDQEIAKVLEEWSGAGLLGTVAWTNVVADGLKRPMTTISENGVAENKQLFDLLTSRIWSQVSVVGVRQQNLATLSAERFDAEYKILQMVQDAFSAHKELEFQSFTVSIAEEKGLVYEAFSPYWKMHILHEPIVRIDQAVASQPMWDDQRHLLVSLLALTMSGGFVWQLGALAPGMADQVVGTHRSIRVGRAYLRVVSAGRLTDEVLAGAFPKSGPWSIPTDVPNALAVPPGTAVTESLVDGLVQRGKFTYESWIDPKREKPKNMKLLDGLKLFGKEFVAALKSIPTSLVEKIKSDVEDFVQKLTFGEEASVLLRFNPKIDDLNPDDVLEVIKNLQLGTTVDPISDSEPWEVLQRVSLGVVDGGRFPEGLAAPARGSNRLIYTDPVTIGPAPDDVSFEVNPFEVTLLNLQETQSSIGSMAVGDALTLKTHLEALREELAIKPVEQSKGVSDKKTKDNKSATDATAKKKVGRIKRARLRIKEIFGKRKAKKLASKNAKNQTTTSTPLPTPVVGSADANSTTSSPNDSVVAPNAQVATDPLTKAVDNSDSVDESNRHSPKHPDFKVSEYTPIGAFYQGKRPEIVTEYAEANRICESAQSTYKSVNGRFAKDKSCDHCGTAFDHGLLYLHEPTKKLLRVGNVCARKSLPDPSSVDLVASRLNDVEKRFTEWLLKRSGSLLWRVGEAIVSGLVVARKDLAICLEILASRPVLQEESNKARIKFGKWTRRGLLSVLLVIAAAVASIIFTPLPLLIAVLIVTTYFSSFIIRMIFLARDIVRAQYKFRLAMDQYERSYYRARHNVEEVVRLSSVNDQFDDWQVVVRELVHLPFGREIGFATTKAGIDDVTRPPAMVLGKSHPDEKQRMQLFLQARRQTIHAGWLGEILDMLKQEWRNDYENARLTTSADNVLPESDNAPSTSVVGKRPLSDEDVYYPRTDFRRCVTAGDLQRALVMKKAEQVAIDLRQTSLDRLLAKVEVAGLGAALSGQTVENFLAGLSQDSGVKVAFPADLISDSHPNYRIFEPELILPLPGTLNSESGQIQVQPGVELTAAAWRVELSEALEPLDILRGFDTVVKTEVVQPVSKNKPLRF